MTKSFNRFALFLSVSYVLGCSAMRERPKTLQWNPHRDALVQKYSKDDSWYQAYSDAVNSNKLSQAQALRDQVIYELIWLVDDRYNDFENGLNKDSALTDTGSTVTSLAATTAATVTHSPGTKNVLAAVSTLVTGTDSAFNSNFFQSKARTAIIAAMRSGRAEVLTKLTTGMSLKVANYTLAQGLTDLLAYDNAGTIVSAINTIGDNAKQQKDQAQIKANTELHLQ